jgi:hypothetical protein
MVENSAFWAPKWCFEDYQLLQIKETQLSHFKTKKSNEAASSSKKQQKLGRKRLNMHKYRSQCKFQLHAGQCMSVIEGVFGLSLSVLYNIAAAVAPDDEVESLKTAAIDCVS